MNMETINLFAKTIIWIIACGMSGHYFHKKEYFKAMTIFLLACLYGKL